MSLSFEFVIEDNRWDAQNLAEIGARVGTSLSAHLIFPEDASAVVMACGDEEIAQLNKDFRSKLQPTNVLSWPSNERGADEDGLMPFQPQLPQDAELGDIAISYETVAREAAQSSTPFVDHVTHLIIHGTLHLLGFDHIRDEDGALMERLEIEILGELDIPDPYL